MTPPTPDLTALEQWAREQMAGCGNCPRCERYKAILALCETVRAQQTALDEATGACHEWAALHKAAVARAEQTNASYNILKDNYRDLLEDKRRAVARAEQAERERDALMVRVDQLRRMADREVTAHVEMRAERDAARAEVAHERLRYDGMRSDRNDWRQRAEQAQAEVAQLRSERDEMLMLAEHPQISDMRDLAQELVYRGQRIIELESAHTEALVPCCVSAACEYCGGTGVAKEMHHE